MNKKIILYQNFYIDKNAERQEEINNCLYENIMCKAVDEIILISDASLSKYIFQKFDYAKVSLLEWGRRPTYNDFLLLFKKTTALHVIANSDIYFNDTLRKAEWIGVNDCYALSRYDRMPDKSLSPHLCRGSQDVWIFSDPPEKVHGADFTLGIPGCDNKFALLLLRSGYTVTNPSKDIKCIHVHNTGIRNYEKERDRIPPPYHLVYPTSL